MENCPNPAYSPYGGALRGVEYSYSRCVILSKTGCENPLYSRQFLTFKRCFTEGLKPVALLRCLIPEPEAPLLLIPGCERKAPLCASGGQHDQQYSTLPTPRLWAQGPAHSAHSCTNGWSTESSLSATFCNDRMADGRTLCATSPNPKVKQEERPSVYPIF